MVELRLLRYFVAVAEELHFGRAARRLLLAQPSLSAQIRKLEHDVGTPLFVRDRRHVELTSAGQAMLQPARRVLAAAAELPALARDAAGVGTLTIGFVPYARGRLLPRLLGAFQRERPIAHVTVRACGDSPEVFNDLRDGRVDAGILRTPVAAPWFQSATLAVEPFCVALPAAHPQAAGERIGLADLADEKFALFPRDLNPAAHDHLMSFFAEAGFTPTIGQASRRMDESLVFVAGGSGVGLFPASVADTIADPGIVFRPIVDPTPTVEIVLGWDVNSLNPLVAPLVAVARALTEQLSTHSCG